jgi:hypothetical protein
MNVKVIRVDRFRSLQLSFTSFKIEQDKFLPKNSKGICHQVLINSAVLSKQEVQCYVLRYTSLFVLFGIWKNVHRSERNLPTKWHHVTSQKTAVFTLPLELYHSKEMLQCIKWLNGSGLSYASHVRYMTWQKSAWISIACTSNQTVLKIVFKYSPHSSGSLQSLPQNSGYFH